MAIYRHSGDIVAQAGCVCVMRKFDESQCHFHKIAFDIIQTIVICWKVQMKVIEQLIVSLKFNGSLHVFLAIRRTIYEHSLIFYKTLTHAMSSLWKLHILFGSSVHTSWSVHALLMKGLQYFHGNLWNSPNLSYFLHMKSVTVRQQKWDFIGQSKKHTIFV